MRSKHGYVDEKAVISFNFLHVGSSKYVHIKIKQYQLNDNSFGPLYIMN
jgi:hypothetical protein